LLVSFFILFGCVQPSVCGDSICSSSESSITCSQDCGLDESSARTIWKSAEPFAIMDWVKTEGVMSIVVKNNTLEALTLNGVQLSLGDYMKDLNSEILPGATMMVDVLSLNCAPGQKYVYSKSDIVFTYSDSAVGDKKQFGSTDILGTCS